MWKVINLADLPGWVKKVTACSRWLFFRYWMLGDCGMDLRCFGYVFSFERGYFGFQGLDIGLRLLYPDFHDAYRQH